MVVVKKDLLSFAAKPISVSLFGAGKTYRAFIVLPVICGLASLSLRCAVLHEPDRWWSYCVGFILGLAYLVGEFPNSFIKRRLGIASGAHHPHYKLLQNIVDKSDSLFVACITYFFISYISVAMTVLLFAVSFFIHVTFSWLLVQLRVKKSF
jgi:CDP-diglyceride synthetase